MSFAATWLELEITILNEMSDKKRQVLYSITYMWNQKQKATNELIYETEIDSQT